jgi:ABC-type branched-subunit amino acid transport system permease subunit
VLIFAVIVLSIAIVTGWAGQVSLGQMAIVAIGAALGAKATTEWGLDLALAAPLMGVVGAVVAVLVGLPALRLRGIYLAVSTLAFAVATVHYFLNPQFFDWVPTQGFHPAPLLGRWDYAATTEGTYQLCLGFFVLSVAAVSGIRHSRVGRAMHALREDEQVAEAYGISVARAKLAAFAVSGFFAGVAGAVLVHHNHQFTLGLFPVEENVTTFSAAVVGGMGSITGAILGAVFLKGGQWFLQGDWRLFASATGVLIVLLLVPGGLGGALFRARDLGAAALGRRRGIAAGAPPEEPLTPPAPIDQPAPVTIQPVATGGAA